MRGRFISIEGGEGVGKSTQSALLVNMLKSHGIEVVQTREPGGTDGAEAIRALLLTGGADRWGFRAEALLFAAARADHVERLILPALERGAWVVCDRFIDSSRAYQGGAGGLNDSDILALHSVGSQGLMPDLTLVLELPVDQAMDRAFKRDADRGDRIGARDESYHDAVSAAFRRFAEAEPRRIQCVDAGGDPPVVHARIRALVEPLLTVAS